MLFAGLKAKDPADAVPCPWHMVHALLCLPLAVCGRHVGSLQHVAELMLPWASAGQHSSWWPRFVFFWGLCVW